MQTEGIGRKTAYRRRAVQAVTAFTAADIANGRAATVAGLIASDVIPPAVAGARAGPCRVLPLRLGGQAIILTRLRAQPGRVGPGLAAIHKDHRSRAPAPAEIAGPRSTRGVGKAVVLGKGHFIPTHGNTFADRDRAQRPFIAGATRLARRRPHAKTAAGQHHHLRALAAVSQGIAKDFTLGIRRRHGGADGRGLSGGNSVLTGADHAQQHGKKQLMLPGQAAGQNKR